MERWVGAYLRAEELDELVALADGLGRVREELAHHAFLLVRGKHDAAVGVGRIGCGRRGGPTTTTSTASRGGGTATAAAMRGVATSRGGGGLGVHRDLRLVHFDQREVFVQRVAAEDVILRREERRGPGWAAKGDRKGTCARTDSCRRTTVGAKYQ